jgi:hypothetical protein
MAKFSDAFRRRIRISTTQKTNSTSNSNNNLSRKMKKVKWVMVSDIHFVIKLPIIFYSAWHLNSIM